MAVIVFEKVSVKGVKQWTDAEGKRRQKTMHFMQTINPYNKNADGSVKTYYQIKEELKKERAAWLEEPST